MYIVICFREIADRKNNWKSNFDETTRNRLFRYFD